MSSISVDKRQKHLVADDNDHDNNWMYNEIGSTTIVNLTRMIDVFLKSMSLTVHIKDKESIETTMSWT
jgi:hypothetical protein